MNKKEQLLRRMAMYMRRTTGVSPNGLSFFRVFLTPWIALMIVETLKWESVTLAVITIVLYMIVVLTDLFDGPLARAMRDGGDDVHDIGYGGVLDRVGDKLLVVFSLVPFGAHPLVVVLIVGESLLAYQALHAQTEKKKQATYVGKVKMFLQTFLMPILLVSVFYGGQNFSSFVDSYMAITVIFTILSVTSHYRK